MGMKIRDYRLFRGDGAILGTTAIPLSTEDY